MLLRSTIPNYIVGVVVQGNYGGRRDLLFDGIPLTQELLDYDPPPEPKKDGSIIVTIATDAPLSERQLGRLCRRGILGLGRIGANARHTSGDLLIAFSNAPENRVRRTDRPARQTYVYLDDEIINDLFVATIEATAESVFNAMVAAETMIGRDDHYVPALPMDWIVTLMQAMDASSIQPSDIAVQVSQWFWRNSHGQSRAIGETWGDRRQRPL